MAAFSERHCSESNKNIFESVKIKLFECDSRGTSSLKLQKKSIFYISIDYTFTNNTLKI